MYFLLLCIFFSFLQKILLKSIFLFGKDTYKNMKKIYLFFPIILIILLSISGCEFNKEKNNTGNNPRYK